MRGNRKTNNSLIMQGSHEKFNNARTRMIIIKLGRLEEYGKRYRGLENPAQTGVVVQSALYLRNGAVIISYMYIATPPKINDMVYVIQVPLFYKVPQSERTRPYNFKGRKHVRQILLYISIETTHKATV